jgi:hypothetical protein
MRQCIADCLDLLETSQKPCYYNASTGIGAKNWNFADYFKLKKFYPSEGLWQTSQAEHQQESCDLRPGVGRKIISNLKCTCKHITDKFSTGEWVTCERATWFIFLWFNLPARATCSPRQTTQMVWYKLTWSKNGILIICTQVCCDKRESCVRWASKWWAKLVFGRQRKILCASQNRPLSGKNWRRVSWRSPNNCSWTDYIYSGCFLDVQWWDITHECHTHAIYVIWFAKIFNCILVL